MYPSTDIQTFTLFPILDLTSPDPASLARQWMRAGAHWLHVNQAGASPERLVELIRVVKMGSGRAQVEGDLNTLDQVGWVLNKGFKRAILGDTAVRQPFLLAAALDKWGPDRITLRLDEQNGRTASGSELWSAARWFAQMGLRWLIVDGLEHARTLSEIDGLNVVAAVSPGDLLAARSSGLAGVLIQQSPNAKLF